MALSAPLMVLAAVATGAPPVAAARNALASPRFLPVGSLAHVPGTARDLGALDPAHVIEVGVALRPRSPAALAALATGVSSPGSPLFHHYLDRATFATEFGATPATVSAVESVLRSAGLRPGPISSNRLLIPISATVGRLQAAFRTKLVGYRLSGGSLGWAAASAPLLPASVAADLAGIVGLDNLYEPHSLVESPAVAVSGARSSASRANVARRHPTAAPSACRVARSDARSGGGWTDDQIATAYGLDRLFAAGGLGAGQTIALFELEPYLPSDVATFDRCYFDRNVTNQVRAVRVDGFRLTGPGSGESILDIEDLSALAPAAHIVVYEAPNTTFGAIDEYNEIVSQDAANIVSSSWGECEEALQIAAPGTEQLENSIFEEAAAQGQTFVAASGDTGSDDCASTPFSSTIAVKPYLSVDDPADQPFVVAVGGTSLASDEQPLPLGSETAWNDGSVDGGGGGGISQAWPSPAWQDGSGVPGVPTTGNRAIPDVSASADQRRGVTVFSAAFAPAGAPAHSGGANSGWSTIGGTSSSAPIWAAVLADIAASGSTGTSCAELPVNSGGTDLGFVAPELYEVAAHHYTSSFNDVTVGNNDVFALGDGYAATNGWDAATGLGSPVVENPDSSPGLAAYLCAAATGVGSAAPAREAITAVSPAFGPASGGNAVSIALASPLAAGATVRVAFGAAEAAVVSSSGTTVNVTVPSPPITNGSAPFAGAGPAAVRVLVSAGGVTASSLPGPASVYDYVNEAPSGAALPTVTGIGPYGGSVSGGNTVTVYGSGFSSGPVAVSVGGVSARGIHVVSDYELDVTVPPESSATGCARGPGFDPRDVCQTELVVANANGDSPTEPIFPGLSGAVVFSPQGVVDPRPGTEVAPGTTEYDYSPRPVITSIRPNPVNASGNSPVVIRGHGFNLVNLEWVNFGPATNSASEQVEIAFISGSRIEIDPPPESSVGSRLLPGGVSVQTTGGLSNVVRLRYAGTPRVHKLSAVRGPSSGGTAIVLTGSGLTGVLSVNFVGEGAEPPAPVSVSTAVSEDTDTSLRVVAPPSLPGPVDVEPCTASGCATPNPAADTFVFYSPSRSPLGAVASHAVAAARRLDSTARRQPSLVGLRA